MEINKPEDLVKAIDFMLLDMDRKGRVQFLKWVKMKKRKYDFDYPQGIKGAKKDANTIVNPVSNPNSSVASEAVKPE